MMTSEQIQAHIKALLEERSGYEQRGDTARLSDVDAELRAIGSDGSTPEKRAEKRPRNRKAETR